MNQLPHPAESSVTASSETCPETCPETCTAAYAPMHWPAPKSAYVHVPFCRHRCGYCSFSVIASRDELIERYLCAVDRELAGLDRPPIETLYLGGGTPTHLGIKQLTALLALLAKRFDYAPKIEFTAEANPEDIDAEKLRLLSDYGVNRISLGVQSFDQAKLNNLDRSHSRKKACHAIEMSAAMIGNVSIDLIFAAPGETLSLWQQDLQLALALPINHLSAYSLTFEKGTAFWSQRMHGRLRGVDEKSEVAMYRLTQQMTSEAAMPQYEISNYARKGFHSRHNMAYWKGQGWFAAGPGAARFVNGVRDSNHRSTTTYLRRIEKALSPVAESDALSATEYARERAAFGIRMIDGVDLAEIRRETQVDLSALCGQAIDVGIKNRMLIREGDRIRLTRSGILFADLVASEFLE